MLTRIFLRHRSLIIAGFILLAGQITQALSSDKQKDDEVRIVIDDGSFSHLRMLKSVTTSCSYGSYCNEYGDVTDDSTNYFTINMAAYSNIKLTIRVGQSSRDVKISLDSSVIISTMSTDIMMWPDNSYPYNYVSTLYGSRWTSKFWISSSPFSTRELYVAIDNRSLTLSTVLTFKIEVSESSINLAWLIPVVVVGAISIIVGIVIWIRQKRRRRAAALRSTAAQQIQLSSNNQNQNITSVSYQQVSQGYPVTPQPMPVQPQYYPSYTPGMPMPQNVVYQDAGVLSAMNFDTRFPEMLTQNILNLNPSSICSLCYKDFQLNPKCRQLYCGHIFHSECIKPWLLNQMKLSNCATCPACNANMTYFG